MKTYEKLLELIDVYSALVGENHGLKINPSEELPIWITGDGVSFCSGSTCDEVYNSLHKDVLERYNALKSKLNEVDKKLDILNSPATLISINNFSDKNIKGKNK